MKQLSLNCSDDYLLNHALLSIETVETKMQLYAIGVVGR